MGRVCYVPYCTSGYRSNEEKVSTFKVPKNRIEIWNKKIRRKDRKITEKDVVCEKHFSPKFIIKELKTECYTIPLERYELAADAMPTIFPIYPNDCSTTIQNSSSIEHEYSLKTHIKIEEVVLEDWNYGPCDFNTEDCLELSKNLYNILKNERYSLNLPSQTWKLEYLDDVIIIYTLKYLYNNVIMDKKVIITENKIELFIHENVCDTERVSKKSIYTTKKLEEFLSMLSEAKVCAGAFNFNNSPSNFKSKVYVKDIISQCWRHCSCNLIIFDNENICQWCR